MSGFEPTTYLQLVSRGRWHWATAARINLSTTRKLKCHLLYFQIKTDVKKILEQIELEAEQEQRLLEATALEQYQCELEQSYPSGRWKKWRKQYVCWNTAVRSTLWSLTMLQKSKEVYLHTSIDFFVRFGQLNINYVF